MENIKKAYLMNWFHLRENLGGVESRFHNLNRMMREKFSTELVSLSDVGSLSEKFWEQGVLFDEWLTKNDNDDILVVRDGGVGGFRKFQSKQVVTFGNPFVAMRDEAKVKMLKLSASNADVNVAISDFMQSELQKVGIESVVCENGVDDEVFVPVIDEKKQFLRTLYRIPVDKSVGLFVGAMSDVKNFPMMMKLVNASQKIFWLFVLKQGQESKHLVYRRDSNLKVLYDVDYVDMPKMYQMSDFVVFTPTFEGFGNVFLEAMACDVPLVASMQGCFWHGKHWDERIGMPCLPSDFEMHKAYIRDLLRDKTKFAPRQVLFEKGWNLEAWKERWMRIIKSI